MFTLLQIKSAEVRVACHFVGYDSGMCWETDKCACFDWKNYEELVNRKTILYPKKVKKHKAVEQWLSNGD